MEQLFFVVSYRFPNQIALDRKLPDIDKLFLYNRSSLPTIKHMIYTKLQLLNENCQYMIKQMRSPHKIPIAGCTQLQNVKVASKCEIPYIVTVYYHDS